MDLVDTLSTGVHNLMALWVDLGGGVMTAVADCQWCGRCRYRKGGVVTHLRRMDGDRCFTKLWDEFVLWLADFSTKLDVEVGE